MFRFERQSLRKRVRDLERDVQYKKMYFYGSEEMEVEVALELLFKHLGVVIGLQKKDASKTP